MKILLLGASGYLGNNLKSDLLSLGHLVLCPTRMQLNLYEGESLIDFVKSNGPFDRIINCAVYQKTGDALTVNGNMIYLLNSIINFNIIKLLLNINYTIQFDTIGASCAFSVFDNELNYFDGPLHDSVKGFALTKRQMAIALNCLKIDRGHECRIFVPGTLIGPSEQLDIEKKHFFNGTIFRAANSIINNEDFAKFGDMNAERELSCVRSVSQLISNSCDYSELLIKIQPDYKIKVGQLYSYLQSKYSSLKIKNADTLFKGVSTKSANVNVKFDLTNTIIFENCVEMCNIIDESFLYYLEQIKSKNINND